MPTSYAELEELERKANPDYKTLKEQIDEEIKARLKERGIVMVPLEASERSSPE